MKRVIVLVFTIVAAFGAYAQEGGQPVKIYNPAANAQNELNEAVKKAQNENKNVLVQVGGNWCPWCIKLHKFFNEDAEVKDVLASSYVFTLINYSKENKNEAILAKLGNPQRFGFPVLLVINAKGELLHIQDSGYLEEGKGYSKDKVLRFLKLWTVKAINGEK